VTRIYHTWDKWECYPAGFYESKSSTNPDATKDELEEMYSQFLSDEARFRAALERVITEWKFSCEHYLSNENMNRIAWLGQASACLALGIPSDYRGGFHKMSQELQDKADAIALEYLNKWMQKYGEPAFASLAEAASKTEMDLY